MQSAYTKNLLNPDATERLIVKSGGTGVANTAPLALVFGIPRFL